MSLRVNFRHACDLAENLGQLDRLSSEKERDYKLYSCLPSMGLGLFTDLNLSLGDEAFREGFRSLYLKLRDEEHTEECTGMLRGICYVRQAFVQGASPETAAVVEGVIDKWYSGSPLESSVR